MMLALEKWMWCGEEEEIAEGGRSFDAIRQDYIRWVCTCAIDGDCAAHDFYHEDA